jgi:large subunit ribosomal protein L15
VLGDGELTKAVTVRAQKFSQSAVEKIQKAGGTVVVVDERGREVDAEPSKDGAAE